MQSYGPKLKQHLFLLLFVIILHFFNETLLVVQVLLLPGFSLWGKCIINSSIAMYEETSSAISIFCHHGNLRGPPPMPSPTPQEIRPFFSGSWIMVGNHPSNKALLNSHDASPIALRMSEVDLFCGIAEYPHRSAERVRLALECVANLAGRNTLISNLHFLGAPNSCRHGRQRSSQGFGRCMLACWLFRCCGARCCIGGRFGEIRCDQMCLPLAGLSSVESSICVFLFV